MAVDKIAPQTCCVMWAYLSRISTKWQATCTYLTENQHLLEVPGLTRSRWSPITILLTSFRWLLSVVGRKSQDQRGAKPVSLSPMDWTGACPSPCCQKHLLASAPSSVARKVGAQIPKVSCLFCALPFVYGPSSPFPQLMPHSRGLTLLISIGCPGGRRAWDPGATP